jgi:hypothetical protein
MSEPQIHDMIATKTLSLRDRNGLELARLSAENGSPSLEMRDNQGRVRVELTLQRDGRTYLCIFGEDGVPRVNIDVFSDGSPILEISDNNGKVLLGTP